MSGPVLQRRAWHPLPAGPEPPQVQLVAHTAPARRSAGTPLSPVAVAAAAAAAAGAAALVSTEVADGSDSSLDKCQLLIH